MTIMQSEWKAVDKIEDIIDEYHKGEIGTTEVLDLIVDTLKKLGWIKNE